MADDRGNSVGHGFVEYTQKSAADKAIKECASKPYLLGR